MGKDNAEARRMKARAVELLRERLTPEVRARLEAVDARLLEYFDGLAWESGIATAINGGARNQQDAHLGGVGETPDYHNLYEVLGGLRFLRLMATYGMDTQKVRQVLRLREGEWRQEGRRWKHVAGGLAQETPQGLQYFRWMPFQVFVIASVFGFRAWFDTGVEAGTRELLPTEREVGGHIYDNRRLCREFTFYGARKNDKTGLSAFIQVEQFLMEDYDAEAYCIANSADQAKTLYKRSRAMLQQLDPGGQRIRQTATVCDWRPAWRKVRASSLVPLTAGGKTKDGLRASLACADEYGSAPYVKTEQQGMAYLLDVVESSMGSRREPLTFITTTAGRISQGPFIDKLDGLHRMLEGEVSPNLLQASPHPLQREGVGVASDRTMCLLLEPDAWERDEETMLTSRQLRRKVCPALGVIVQQSFYDDAVAKIQREPDRMDEYVTKLMNVYKSDTLEEWITAAEARRLQVPRRVTDCRAADGWLIFTGMDFSLGDDLHALSYLCVRQDAKTGQTEFFADMDAWLTEDSLEASPMRHVYRRWVGDGWLRVSPGATLKPELPVDRIAEIAAATDYNLALWLYDPYRAAAPVNALKAYVASLGARPDDCIIPCRQNYATFNPLVMELDYMVKNTPPLISLSENPLWAWEAGNMVLDISTDGMDNRKPRKRNAAAKIDNWVCLLEALKGFDTFNSKFIINNS